MPGLEPPTAPGPAGPEGRDLPGEAGSRAAVTPGAPPQDALPQNALPQSTAPQGAVSEGAEEEQGGPPPRAFRASPPCWAAPCCSRSSTPSSPSTRTS